MYMHSSTKAYKQKIVKNKEATAITGISGKNTQTHKGIEFQNEYFRSIIITAASKETLATSVSYTRMNSFFISIFYNTADTYIC